jgi:DNA mismatch repair protein MutL
VPLAEKERSVGRIRVLDDPTVNRIAAGEVVERPASVVKELIENSLDAGSRAIDVRVLAGGRRLIRVADDGSGMDRDDALLALERHATSKLDGTTDLHAIDSLGFRGEALPSIAAVSRFTLQTAQEDGNGTEVEVRGGKIIAVREVAIPRGTNVEVAGLFFNVPARRKFLRAEATELSHVVRWVARYALAYREVRFRLEHGPRVMLEAAPAESLVDRIREVYGQLSDRLLPFSMDWPGLRVHGLAGRPVESSPRRDGLQLFVNGRAVQDRVLAHAVREAYGNTMPRGRHPVAFVFVEIEPEAVDVNVHPQKTEVRFSRSGSVHDGVREAVASALSREGAVPDLSDLRPSGTAPSAADSIAASALSYFDSQRESTASEQSREASANVPYGRGPGGAAAAGQGTLLAEGPGVVAQPRVAPWVPLAQYRDSYIVAEDRDGLVLVDQHAAHERVLFERYLEDAEEDRVEIQRLLFPLTLELAPDRAVVLEEELGEFRRLGFTIEPFGGHSFRVDGVPSVLGDLEAGPCLEELLGEAASTRSATAGVANLRRKLITSAACQAAIKINHPLTDAGMGQLLTDLAATENPTTCPHGRPILFRLGLDEIERGFRRR